VLSVLVAAKICGDAMSLLDEEDHHRDAERQEDECDTAPKAWRLPQRGEEGIKLSAEGVE